MFRTLAALMAGVLLAGGAFLGWAYYSRSGPFERAPLEGFVSLNEESETDHFLIFEAAYNGHASALEVQQMAQAHCAQFPINPNYYRGCFIFISNAGEPTLVGDYDSVMANISPRWDSGEIVAGYILEPDFSAGRRFTADFVIDCNVFDPVEIAGISECKGTSDRASRMLRRHAPS